MRKLIVKAAATVLFTASLMALMVVEALAATGDLYEGGTNNKIGTVTAEAVASGVKVEKVMAFAKGSGKTNAGILVKLSGDIEGNLYEGGGGVKGILINFSYDGGQYCGSNYNVPVWVNEDRSETSVSYAGVTYGKGEGYNAFNSVTMYEKSQDKVVEFVRRMYRVVFGREGEESGINYWVDKLKSGEKTGADVVAEFYGGPELKNKGLSNSEVVDLAYKGIMGRGADGGKQYWVDGLDAGATYDLVVTGFIGSSEFADLCSSYGITKGDRTATEARDRNIGVTEYASRLYTQGLGRGYDANGLNYWCQAILDNPSRDNVIDVAFNGFFHSEEFLGRNLSNDEYIKVCYRTFLGREAEGEGFNYWKQLLDSGAKTRDDLVREFAYSQEFSDIMASYGL